MIIEEEQMLRHDKTLSQNVYDEFFQKNGVMTIFENRNKKEKMRRCVPKNATFGGGMTIL